MDKQIDRPNIRMHSSKIEALTEVAFLAYTSELDDEDRDCLRSTCVRRFRDVVVSVTPAIVECLRGSGWTIEPPKPQECKP